MNFRAWGTAFRDAFRSMTQSFLMSLASMATVAVSLLVLAVALLLSLNLEYMASTVEQQVEIKAYLCAAKDENPDCGGQELTVAQKQAILDQVARLPGVKKATFVSREEALERMKVEFGEHRDILEGWEGENPLRDSVEVQVEDATQVKAVAEAMLKIQGVSEANYGQDYVDKLLAFTAAVRLGGVGLVILLIIATVLTISNTIRLAVFARRREISIMKLVGATDWYIRRPFMLEGIFLGAIGALLAMALIGWGYQRFVIYVQQSIPFLPVVKAQDVLMNLTLFLALLGSVLGAVGSLISMRKFLKV